MRGFNSQSLARAKSIPKALWSKYKHRHDVKIHPTIFGGPRPEEVAQFDAMTELLKEWTQKECMRPGWRLLVSQQKRYFAVAWDDDVKFCGSVWQPLYLDIAPICLDGAQVFWPWPQPTLDVLEPKDIRRHPRLPDCWNEAYAVLARHEIPYYILHHRDVCVIYMRQEILFWESWVPEMQRCIDSLRYNLNLLEERHPDQEFAHRALALVQKNIRITKLWINRQRGVMGQIGRFIGALRTNADLLAGLPPARLALHARELLCGTPTSAGSRHYQMDPNNPFSLPPESCSGGNSQLGFEDDIGCLADFADVLPIDTSWFKGDCTTLTVEDDFDGKSTFAPEELCPCVSAAPAASGEA